MSLYSVNDETRTLSLDITGYPDWKLPYRSVLSIRPDKVEYTWTSEDGETFTLQRALVTGNRVLKNRKVSTNSRHEESVYYGGYSRIEAPAWIAELAATITPKGEKW